MPQGECLLSKIGFDTDEDEPSKVGRFLTRVGGLIKRAAQVSRACVRQPTPRSDLKLPVSPKANACLSLLSLKNYFEVVLCCSRDSACTWRHHCDLHVDIALADELPFSLFYSEFKFKS